MKYDHFQGLFVIKLGILFFKSWVKKSIYVSIICNTWESSILYPRRWGFTLVFIPRSKFIRIWYGKFHSFNLSLHSTTNELRTRGQNYKIRNDHWKHSYIWMPYFWVGSRYQPFLGCKKNEVKQNSGTQEVIMKYETNWVNCSNEEQHELTFKILFMKVIIYLTYILRFWGKLPRKSNLTHKTDAFI